MNFNQVMLAGNLTRAPKLSYTPRGTAVVDFGLAVNRKFKRDDGNMDEEVLFIECQCFGKRAEVISNYFDKGSPIFVQGRLKLETWEQDDQRHSRIRVIVQNFEFIERRPESYND